MKTTLLAALLLGASTLAQADTEAQEKLQALEVLVKHSQTVACDTTFEAHPGAAENYANIHTVERDAAGGWSTYFILWGGDMGCNRGSGTSSYFVSEVGRYSASRPFLVRSNAAFGQVLGQVVDPRFIRKLERAGDRRFVIVSSEHAGNDPNNFPSNRYQYLLEQQQGTWRVTERKFLGKNRY
ncbi:hypothetical protein [Pseudorhodoferax sp.]|uniref:hypothetical protein n=1 Tax=Pseudorhodoferax sp. TaxID=1993553 RepID=UPI0039E3B088